MGVTPEKEWKPIFLKRLAETGNVTDSCRKADISRKTVYEAKGSDTLFAEAWEDALKAAVELLELEARRRAYKGTLEPIYYQGKKVGAVRKYSDTLMIFLLKAHAPEKYRENLHVEHSGEMTMISLDR